MVVFFVEGCFGGGVFVGLDDFLLGGGGSFDELGDGGGDGYGGVENRVVDVEFVGGIFVVRFVFEFLEVSYSSSNGVSCMVEFLVDYFVEVFFVGKFVEVGSEVFDGFVEFL